MARTFKRCFHYDRKGIPRTEGGCPRKDRCNFVHPSDSDWDEAPDSGLPPPPPRPQRPSSPRPRHYATQMARDRSPTRHQTRRSRSPPSRRSGDHSRPRSRDYSGGELSYDTSRRHNHDQSTAPSPRKDSFSAITAPSTRAAAPQSQPDPQPQPQLQRPPEPANPQPFPPPPPVPVTSFLSKKSPPAPAPTHEEARVIWLERIKLLASAARSNSQLARITENADRFRKIADVGLTLGFDEEDQQKLKTELATMDSEREEAEKQLETHIEQLTKSRSWPADPLAEAEEGELEKHHELMKYIEALKDTVNEMTSVLNDIRERNISPPKHQAVVDVDMDVGSSESFTRPTKRRRLSDSTNTQAEQQHSVKDIELLREKLISIDDRITTFENDLNAHDAELREEMNERLDAKLEELQLAPDPINNRYQEINDNINYTGEQMTELAKEIGDLILQANEQKSETAAVQLEIEASKTDFMKLQERLQEHEQAREKNRNALAALEAHLSAHMTRPPSPPSPTWLSTHDYILEKIEEPLLDLVHANIQPIIEDLRSQVEDMLCNQNKEIHESLHGKLSITLQMVESISRRFERTAGQGGGMMGS